MRDLTLADIQLVSGGDDLNVTLNLGTSYDQFGILFELLEQLMFTGLTAESLSQVLHAKANELNQFKIHSIVINDYTITANS